MLMALKGMALAQSLLSAPSIYTWHLHLDALKVFQTQASEKLVSSPNLIVF